MITNLPIPIYPSIYPSTYSLGAHNTLTLSAAIAALALHPEHHSASISSVCVVLRQESGSESGRATDLFAIQHACWKPCEVWLQA
ncbi:predicted protein [Botrytis cinerea T4]|uniref:Uncharacterized protein n=1 Tax=Botryotinia fuckeliana (strain T4) TaxID=999810 RepID=G2XWZ9_BOTF4|nr:predicted protein [Botrytis cinerea T4]